MESNNLGEELWKRMEPQLQELVDDTRQEERQRIISLIEGMKQPFKVSENMELREGWNQALEAIKEKINT